MHQRLTPYCSQITAHRGGAFHSPENTLTAFRTAAAMGVQWVETDVCILADKTPILFHDPDFSRICDVQEDVRLTTWEKAKSFSIKDNPCNCTPESIPTLEAGLKLIHELGLSLNLELKIHGDERQDLLDAALPLVDHYWQRERDLLITSFDIEILRLVRAKRPQSALGYICERIPENWQELAEELNLTSFNPNHKSLNRALVQNVIAHGLDIYAYTPNQADLVEHMWDWGLTGVITDNLDAFTSLIPQKTHK